MRVSTVLDVDALAGLLFMFYREEGLSPEALDPAAEIQENVQLMGDIFLEGDQGGPNAADCLPPGL